MPETSPTLARRVLGARLRRLREERNETYADIADILGYSPKSVQRIEEGKQGTKKIVVKELAEHFELSNEERSHLFTLVQKGKERGWWESYFDVGRKQEINPDFPLFLEAEQDSVLIQNFESDLISGLLQTRAYVQELQSRQSPLPEDVADTVLRVRMGRQELIFRKHQSARIEFLIGQNAILSLRELPAQIRLEQIHRIREIAAFDYVGVRVVTEILPTSRTGPFTLIATATDGFRFVYLESLDGCRYVEQPDVVSLYGKAFNETFPQATDIEEYLEHVELR